MGNDDENRGRVKSQTNAERGVKSSRRQHYRSSDRGDSAYIYEYTISSRGVTCRRTEFDVYLCIYIFVKARSIIFI